MDTFQVIHDSKNGQALYSDTPKIDAYKHMAFMQRMGYTTSLDVADGMYTVKSHKNGMETRLTFEPWPVPEY